MLKGVNAAGEPVELPIEGVTALYKVAEKRRLLLEDAIGALEDIRLQGFASRYVNSVLLLELIQRLKGEKP